MKYLDHELIQIDPNKDMYYYRCINCNVILYKAFDKNYYIIIENPYIIYKFLYTCKEWIIKNIIE